MDVRAHHQDDLAQLERRIGRQRDAQQRDRYRVVWLALRGEQTLAIQRLTQRSRGFVQRWVYAYRDDGLAALTVRRRGGSKPKLGLEQQRRFIARIKAGPSEADGGVCTLRGKDAQRIAHVEFGVRYSLNGVYKIMHRHGLSCLKPRPRHRKHDEQAQQRWKQSAPLLSSASGTSAASKPSKSGSRTKRASASKAP